MEIYTHITKKRLKGITGICPYGKNPIDNLEIKK
jgi:hypothetical protein